MDALIKFVMTLIASSAIGFLLGALTGAGASVAATLIGRFLSRAGTETFEVRSKSGEVLTSFTLTQDPTPEEAAAAVEKVRRLRIHHMPHG